MKMKTVSDSASVKVSRNRAGVYAAGVLATLIQFQTNACYAQQPVSTYTEYVNERYSYSVCYPESIFAAQGENASKDGQLFIAEDGARLRVYADYNISNKTIQDTFKDAVSDEKSKGVVTLKTQRGNSFIISGKHNGNIFYQKTILEKDSFISFRAIYPETASAAYADVVTAVGKCLKPLEPR
jgi:hypothetical protein